MGDSGRALFEVKAEAFDAICERLEGAALIRSRIFSVFPKLDNGLEADDGGSDLGFEDSDDVGGGGFREVDDDRL